MNPTVIFAAGFLILFLGGGARFAIGLTLKPMVDELGWVRGDIGAAVLAYLVVSAVATYLAGRLADRSSPSLLLNTGFSAPQLADVLEREGATLIVYDEEFAGLVSEARQRIPGLVEVLSWVESEADSVQTAERLIELYSRGNQ